MLRASWFRAYLLDEKEVFTRARAGKVLRPRQHLIPPSPNKCVLRKGNFPWISWVLRFACPAGSNVKCVRAVDDGGGVGPAYSIAFTDDLTVESWSVLREEGWEATVYGH